MITNNTNYLEQIYDAVKDYEDVDVVSQMIDGSIVEFENDKIATIGSYAFQGCSSLASIDLPNVTNIGNGAFSYCSSLASIDLPNVTNIGNDGAFRGCSSLASIDLPNVTSLGSYAFQGCSSLASIDLPNVTNIGDGAFRNCDALTSVIIRTEIQVVKAAVISNLDGTFYILDATPIASGTGYIYVPKALIEDYKVASGWSTYASQFRALEDYTIDGTTTGELDETKI